MNVATSSSRLYNILLVEDNEDDVWLVRRGLKRINAPVEVHVASDGVEALGFLRREGQFADAPRPDLILLDLNMPRMDGRQLLVELKHDEQLRTIPAVVLSTSDFEHEVHNAYREHASAYLTKPFYLHESAARTQCFIDFWFGGVALLPTPGESVAAR